MFVDIPFENIKDSEHIENFDINTTRYQDEFELIFKQFDESNYQHTQFIDLPFTEMGKLN